MAIEGSKLMQSAANRMRLWCRWANVDGSELRGKEAILQHCNQFRLMMESRDPLVTLKTMIIFKWMLMKDQQQQVSARIHALIARDMKDHVETKIKEDQEKEDGRGKSSNEDRHSIMSVFA